MADIEHIYLALDRLNAAVKFVYTAFIIFRKHGLVILGKVFFQPGYLRFQPLIVFRKTCLHRFKFGKPCVQFSAHAAFARPDNFLLSFKHGSTVEHVFPQSQCIAELLRSLFKTVSHRLPSHFFELLYLLYRFFRHGPDIFITRSYTFFKVRQPVFYLCECVFYSFLSEAAIILTLFEAIEERRQLI